MAAAAARTIRTVAWLGFLCGGACGGVSPQSPPLTGAAAVSVSGSHACTVMADGTAACWGESAFGELGNGRQGTPVPAPTPVVGLAGLQAITAGNVHSCGLQTDGSVLCWGEDAACQIGDRCAAGQPPQAYAGPVLTPTPVPGLSAPALAVQASAIQSRSLGFTCALLAGGTISCWGEDALGLGADPTALGIPATPVGGVTDAVAMAIGGTFGCDLRSDGTVECWGLGPLGQPGISAASRSATPLPVPGLSDVRAIAAGWFHACALLGDGTVACWGNNTSGQLGDGTQTESPTPVQVSGLTGAVAISTSATSTCALLAGGSVRCWGADASQLVPSPVSGVSGATSLSVAELSACAVAGGGEIRCWGRDEYGQLGDGVPPVDRGDVAEPPVTDVAPR
jgi:alpha-tubulin suppressor-like RCC1 family protein